MRAEYLIGQLMAHGIQYDGIPGRSTRPYDETRAYLGRVSEKAFLYALVVHGNVITDANIYKLYLNVASEVSKDWKSIGVKPQEPEALKRWKAKNSGLIRRMTLLALQEAIKPSIGGAKKAEWRATQMGVSERRWRQEYRDRYARVCEVLNDWEGEFCGKVAVNQREPEMA